MRDVPNEAILSWFSFLFLLTLYLEDFHLLLLILIKMMKLILNAMLAIYNFWAIVDFFLSRNRCSYSLLSVAVLSKQTSSSAAAEHLSQHSGWGESTWPLVGHRVGSIEPQGEGPQAVERQKPAGPDPHRSEGGTNEGRRGRQWENLRDEVNPFLRHESDCGYRPLNVTGAIILFILVLLARATAC